jgi:hypothetical protein
MIVQIDNKSQNSHFISPSFIGSVQAYVEALEQHKVRAPLGVGIWAHPCS